MIKIENYSNNILNTEKLDSKNKNINNINEKNHNNRNIEFENENNNSQENKVKLNNQIKQITLCNKFLALVRSTLDQISNILKSEENKAIKLRTIYLN